MQKTEFLLSEQFFSPNGPSSEIVCQAVNLWLKTALTSDEKGDETHHALCDLHQTEQRG